MKRILKGVAMAVAVAGGMMLMASVAQAQPVKVDSRYKAYHKAKGIKGNLNSVGSDTLNNLMTFWAEGFKAQYPDVNIQIEGKGSSTAPPALTEGVAQLGPMSRDMKSKEVDDFEAKRGFKPTGFKVSVDGLAVFVNKDNPVKSLSLAQVDAIFGKSRKRGAASDVTSWGQLGLAGEYAGKPLVMFGRNSASGTYGYFKEHALDKGDFKDSVKEQPGSASVVQGVSEDRYAIGYSGIGYVTSGVRAVPLAVKDGDPVYDTSADNVYSGKYPLARYLNVYVAKDPKKGLDPVAKEFLRFVFSKEGQEIVIKDGFLPLPYEVAQEMLKQLK